MFGLSSLHDIITKDFKKIIMPIAGELGERRLALCRALNCSLIGRTSNPNYDPNNLFIEYCHPMATVEGLHASRSTTQKVF